LPEVKTRSLKITLAFTGSKLETARPTEFAKFRTRILALDRPKKQVPVYRLAI
jgi:hypothetical protein